MVSLTILLGNFQCLAVCPHFASYSIWRRKLFQLTPCPPKVKNQREELERQDCGNNLNNYNEVAISAFVWLRLLSNYVLVSSIFYNLHRTGEESYLMVWVFEHPLTLSRKCVFVYRILKTVVNILCEHHRMKEWASDLVEPLFLSCLPQRIMDLTLGNNTQSYYQNGLIPVLTLISLTFYFLLLPLTFFFPSTLPYLSLIIVARHGRKIYNTIKQPSLVLNANASSWVIMCKHNRLAQLWDVS